MKKNTGILWVLLLAVVALIGVSCSAKEEGESIGGEDLEQTLLPIKVENTIFGEVYHFSYDEQDRLVEVEYVDSSWHSKTLLTYHAAGCVVDVGEVVNGVRTTYAIDSFILVTPQKVEVVSIYVEEDGFRDKETYYMQLDNGRPIKRVYQNESCVDTYDTRGNMISRAWTSSGSEQDVVTVDYNTSKGVFSNVKSPMWLLSAFLDADIFGAPGFLVNNPLGCNTNGQEDVRRITYPDRKDFPNKVQVQRRSEGTEYSWTVEVTYK